MRLLQEGQTIRDTYEVDRFLGEGAFAEVYRVNHRFLGRQAMKVFKMTGLTLKETGRLLEEAILLTRMGHSNIIRVFHANVVEVSSRACCFFTMEYVAGGNLENFWRSHDNQFVPIETTRTIMQQICRGIATAHRENPPIIHRDIKPQNILIGYDESGLRARISDFGLAKQVNPLTLLASAQGTFSFKAPEVFEDPGRDSTAGDVWALGSVLYLLLTDRMPFSQQDENDLPDFKNFQAELIPPSRLNVKADSHMDRIILKALAHDPDDRYKDAGQLYDALCKWKIPDSIKLFDKSQVHEEQTKTALGIYPAVDINTAKQLAQKALTLKTCSGQLSYAADLMEEAINKWPELRNKYEYNLRLWRKGVVM